MKIYKQKTTMRLKYEINHKYRNSVLPKSIIYTLWYYVFSLNNHEHFYFKVLIVIALATSQS